MSTASRLISGSAATWGIMGVNVISQIALIPIYLSHWSVETYGVWLSISALISFITILDWGHLEFLNYEFLRLGKDDLAGLKKYLWSGVGVSVIVNLIGIVFVLFFLATNILSFLLDKANLLTPSLIQDAGLVLLGQSLTTPITSVASLFFRVLSPFGYYPRMVWWNFFGSIVYAVVPVVAVLFGADLLLTGIVTTCAKVVFNGLIHYDLFYILRKEKITYTAPSWKLGYKNYVQSLSLLGRILLENARQQGVRTFLGPLSGATGLVAFSTMRTGANVALQGLRSVTSPLMPELTRFLHQRDQVRVDASFAIVWIILVALIAPIVVTIQAFVEPFYTLWTQGRVPFDPQLFAVFSLTILVHAVAQPAMAVVTGNNILKPQLILSAVAAGIVIAGITGLVPKTGILGAGIALLVAEIVVTRSYRIIAERWLHENGLVWPKQSFAIALTSIWISALAMGAMTQFPQMKWTILFFAYLLFYWNFWRYWQILPAFAVNRVRNLVSSLPGLKRLYVLE